MTKRLNRREIYNGKVISLVCDDVVLDNGISCQREVVLHNGGVCIGLEDDGYFYMVRQYRYPFDEEILEFPAGKLEKNESPDDAIKRETIEETGYIAKDIVKLGTIIPTCGYSNEKIHLYYGKVDKFVGQNFDEDEYMTVEKYTLAQIDEMIKKGQITDSKSIAVAYYLRGISE